MSKKRFANKVVLITGASSGIGWATAQAFASEGAFLMLVARREERLKELASICKQLGSRSEYMALDVQNQQKLNELAKKTISMFGHIDVLVNNAGVGHYGDFDTQTADQITQVINTNLTSTMLLTHQVIPYMKEQGSGSIINVSSVLSQRAIPKLASYCASKFGVWGFSSALRIELQNFGLHVCHFCPGLTKTEFQQHANMPDVSQSPRAVSSEAVASKILDAVYFKKNEYMMSKAEAMLVRFYWLFPRFTGRIIKFLN
ncbi:SDR family NAD(P)-dependent oxidoreductase [bacterium]|nr:SDR family NAD(P)-dependent oxidoreductase [bacterium]